MHCSGFEQHSLLLTGDRKVLFSFNFNAGTPMSTPKEMSPPLPSCGHKGPRVGLSVEQEQRQAIFPNDPLVINSY